MTDEEFEELVFLRDFFLRDRPVIVAEALEQPVVTRRAIAVIYVVRDLRNQMK